MGMLSKKEIKRMNNKEYWEGAIRESNNYGKFEIVEYVGYSEVYIRFLDTGYERLVSISNIKTKEVKDLSKDRITYTGTIWNSKTYGVFEIIDYIDSTKVLVRFLETGYETTTTLGNIKKGSVKDKLHASVRGVGYIGEGKYTSKVKGVTTKACELWRSILQRCYDEGHIKKNPTYRGCTVAEEWHNFQNFAKWFETNYVEGYELDKDIRVEGNKVYGPNTCMFVSKQKNIEQACSKHYTILSPDGVRMSIYNLRKFCKDNSLSSANIHKVIAGKRKHHKGWTRYEEENNNDNV